MSVESLVLFNHALLAKAEEACVRSSFERLIKRNHQLLDAAEAAQARSREIVLASAKRTLRARELRLNWAQDRSERALYRALAHEMIDRTLRGDRPPF